MKAAKMKPTAIEGVVGMMLRAGVEVTEQSWLECTYMGEIPEEIPPETYGYMAEEFTLYRELTN